MTSVSACHIILTPTQPVGSRRPQPESNPGPPHQEPRALPTELPRHPDMKEKKTEVSDNDLTYLLLLSKQEEDEKRNVTFRG